MNIAKDVDRLMSRVVVSETDCWLWTGSKDPCGYAQVWFAGKNDRGHRVMYRTFVGAVPEGMQLDHICHDPDLCKEGDRCPHRACMNPDHLRPVSARENSLRGNGVGAVGAAKTHCPKGHEYTPENTYIRAARGDRRCRECRRQDTQARRWTVGPCFRCGDVVARADGSICRACDAKRKRERAQERGAA